MRYTVYKKRCTTDFKYIQFCPYLISFLKLDVMFRPHTKNITIVFLFLLSRNLYLSLSRNFRENIIVMCSDVFKQLR